MAADFTGPGQLRGSLPRVNVVDDQGRPFGLSDAYNYTFINTATTTTIATSGGYINGVLLGQTTTGNTYTFYDNTTAAAPIIAEITSGNTVTLFMDMKAEYNTGLTVDTTGATGAFSLTVFWRPVIL